MNKYKLVSLECTEPQHNSRTRVRIPRHHKASHSPGARTTGGPYWVGQGKAWYPGPITTPHQEHGSWGHWGSPNPSTMHLPEDWPRTGLDMPCWAESMVWQGCGEPELGLAVASLEQGLASPGLIWGPGHGQLGYKVTIIHDTCIYIFNHISNKHKARKKH